ncbi:MAG: cadherin domain-containing protein, partial [Opitutales bacterium]|nr:cadherin domain-containing protein [Opitutales bacterium]
AHYKPSNEDSDSDGVMDWFELYQFGDLNQSGTDDPDGDGFSNKREGELGQEATIVDSVEWGGISGRLSPGILYYQQQNRPPYDLELNNSYALLNKDVNASIGTFTPRDLDDPGVVRPYTYQLLSGAGGEDNSYFNLLGRELRASQSFTTEGNFSIQVRVMDDEGESFDENFTIRAVEPSWDEDGDGLGLEQEFANETNPTNPDSDGDGANDGAEVTAGTNPLDPSVFPNRSPRDLNSTTTLTILENQPVGSTVGEFNATDPDGDAITFHLVSGAGDENNSLFTLESNGTLKTATTFDYESNASTYTIRVQAKDDENAILDSQFNVMLLNIDEPPENLRSNKTLEFEDTQSIGGVVGHFYADDPEGGSIQFELTDAQTPIKQVATGARHTVLLREDGVVLTAGDNFAGQLGDGTTSDRSSFVFVKDINGSVFTGVERVFAGGFTTIFIKEDQTVWITGYNNYGQLGRGDTVNARNPIQVNLSDGTALTEVSTVAAGHYHTAYLMNDGTAWICGRNDQGQLGVGSTLQKNELVRVLVSEGLNLSGITGAALGLEHSLFLMSDQTVRSCGENGSGQLGDSSFSRRLYPVAVNNNGTILGSVAEVSTGAGGNHSVFLKTDGTAWACGNDGNRELGDGNVYTGSSNKPVQVKTAMGTSSPNLENIVSVSAGGTFTSFLSASGNIYVCGLASFPPLESRQNFASPIFEQNGQIVSDVESIYAGGDDRFLVFKKTSGEIFAIGSNSQGNFGNGGKISTDYSATIYSPNHNDRFTLESNGTLKTASAFIYESNKTNFIIDLLAKDESNLSTVRKFSISLLQGVRNFPPEDLNATALLSISENQPTGTIVGEFNATDPDGDAITYSFAPPRFEGFSPFLWLDANDRSTITGISQISQWRDKSGNNFHANQSNTSYQPSLLESNGTSMIRFDGTDDLMEVGTILTTTSEIEVFLVAQKEISGGSLYQRLISSFVSGSNNDWTQPNWVITNFKSGGDGTTPIFSARYFNETFASHKIQNLTIGSSHFENFHRKLKGDIAELIIFSQPLTLGKKQQVQGYLAHKWGFVNTLPTEHPYKFDLFTLDPNGTLKTATTFDYESNASTYTITVQAKDELNATTEGNFTVTLQDVFEDTDGDGFRDSYEMSIGSNLNDANSTPLGYGFIARYPFDGNFSDISGNGNDATNYDSNFTKDRFGVAGKALFFDGVDDRVKLPHNTLNGRSEFTYNLWYKMESGAEPYGALLSGANAQTDNETLLQVNNYLKFDIWDKNTQKKGGYQRSFEWENIWRMLTFVRTNQHMQIYLEDQLFETFEYSHGALSIDEGGLWIGPDQDSVGGGWDETQHLYGAIDEVKIYDRPLTSSEVSFLYSKDSSLIVDLSLPKRVIDWNQTFSGLHEGSGSINLDANASGHNSAWVNLVAPENAVTGFPSSGFHSSHPAWLATDGVPETKYLNTQISSNPGLTINTYGG